MQEIERKYLLVDDSFKGYATACKVIKQGYLSLSERCTVRIRRSADKAYMTVKGQNAEGRIAHFEWEKEIDLQDFEALLPLCEGIIIDKERYIVPLGELKVEIDVFHGVHEGLVLAEIELPREDYQVTLPPFIGKEVTDDIRYYNSYLAQHTNIPK